MNIILLSIVIFLFSVFTIELLFYAVRMIRFPDRAEVQKRLKRTIIKNSIDENKSIIKQKVLSDIPFLNRIFIYSPIILRIDKLIKQANLNYTAGFLILFSCSLGFTCFLLCLFLTNDTSLSILPSIFSTSIPFFYVRHKKKKRMAKFERQLLDGLGLIARALRAGHSFASGMKLASEEFGDPLGPEFEETLDEINYGSSVQDALKNLIRRIDCPDLSFFVVSVILQRETGGNLAEIIEGLAHLIRERFKFRGKVRVLSADGRFSAIILIILPFFVLFVINFISPNHVNALLFDPIGRVLLGIAIFMMFIGVLFIRRIISIDV